MANLWTGQTKEGGQKTSRKKETEVQGKQEVSAKKALLVVSA